MSDNFSAFDADNIHRFSDPRGFSEREVVDALDYDTLLFLYKDSQQYAAQQSDARKYWSVHYEELRRAFLYYIAADNGHDVPTKGDEQELEGWLKMSGVKPLEEVTK